MASQTPNYNLSALNANDAFALDGYKFTDADRVTIDRLLHAALTHDHTGVTPEDDAETVDDPPVLTLDPSTGSLPAGVRFYYKIALIGADGLPTLASPETTIDAPNPVLSPAGPTATRSSTDGTLNPGTYYYRLSVYRSADTLETVAGNAVAVPLPVASGTEQRVILTFPDMPLGGEGFNVYRRIPGGPGYLHIATVTAEDAADPWIDDGSLTANCERFSPSSNTTSSSNSVEIAYPGGVVPVGYTWRIYRADTSDWAHSLLIDVVEETSEGSGIITPTYLDLGIGTTAGSPPTTTPPTIVTPAQISYSDLLDAPAVDTAQAVVLVTFDPIAVADIGTQPFEWACPYDQAILRSVHANVTDTPVAADVNVSVAYYDSDAVDFVAISDDVDAPCAIATGDLVSTVGLPLPDDLRGDLPELHVYDLVAGDRLHFTVTGGDDPITGLVVQLRLWVRDSEPAPSWPDLTP